MCANCSRCNRVAGGVSTSHGIYLVRLGTWLFRQPISSCSQEHGGERYPKALSGIVGRSLHGLKCYATSKSSAPPHAAGTDHIQFVGIHVKSPHAYTTVQDAFTSTVDFP